MFVTGEMTEDMADNPPKTKYRNPKHGPSEHLPNIFVDTSEKPEGATSNLLSQHYCYAVETSAEVEKWYEYLVEHDISILGLEDWFQGSRSEYFADPDEHVGEIRRLRD